MEETGDRESGAEERGNREGGQAGEDEMSVLQGEAMYKTSPMMQHIKLEGGLQLDASSSGKSVEKTMGGIGAADVVHLAKEVPGRRGQFLSDSRMVSGPHEVKCRKAG
jgi:hypothetical protein